MASENRKSGLTLPSGILQSTTPHELTEQGAEHELTTDQTTAQSTTKGRKRKNATVRADTGDEGTKLYLTADVRFRLRMLAFQRGKTLTSVANDLLDKALPKWKLERSE